MMQAGQQGQQQRPGGPQQRIKRNSTSPGEEHETLPRNESSPPERKRIRRSPAEPPAMAPISYPHSGQQQPGHQQSGQPPQQQLGQLPNQQQMSAQQQQQMNSLMMMRAQVPMNSGVPMGGGPGGGPPPQQQQSQQQQHLGPPPLPLGQPPVGMPPGLMQMGIHPPGSMMSPQQQHQQQMHANQQQLYRLPKQGGGPDHSFNPGPLPGGPGSQFNSSPLNRLGQPKPTLSGMMPPPSPAMNGPPKDGNKDGNNANKGPAGGNPPNGQQQQQPTHNPDGSPRNQPPGGPSGSGTAPPTPVPSNQPNPQQQQPPPPPNHLAGMMSSTPSMLGMPPTGGMGAAPDMTMFDPSFISSMADGLGGEFDPTTLFRPDGDINFERDFGQWFNPDDNAMGTGLDMK
ncbi:hypothetical protein BDZ97DRAFT_854083 [Flammula alnicola]|nr:hypothetical protein BDZ97DRAFT_854083 [Flammula alnicola]